MPGRIVRSRRNVRIDAKPGFGKDDPLPRILTRAGSTKVRAARPRHRPDNLIPRGFLPLVVH
jgi:hypothetical protein